MWSPFVNGDKYYYFNVTFENDILTVRLTDLTKSWREVISSKDLNERFKAANQILEPLDNDRVFNLLRSGLNPDLEEVSTTLIIEGTNCYFLVNCVETNTSCHFNMTEINSEDFKKDITVPLLVIIRELCQRQEKLKRLLKEKDEEISEYRLEGAKLFRAYKETKRFDDKEFAAECEKNMEKTAKDTVQDTLWAFNRDFNSIYETAVKASQSHTGIKKPDPPQTSHFVYSEQGPSRMGESSRTLVWQLGPQNTKRFKPNKTKIKL